MKKQEIVKKIFKELGIKSTKNDFSEGSTVTKNALLKIFEKLLPKTKTLGKHKLFLIICIILNFDLNDCKKSFSEGGTITKNGYNEIFEKLKK